MKYNQYNKIQHNTIWYNIRQYYTVQHNMCRHIQYNV